MDADKTRWVVDELRKKGYSDNQIAIFVKAFKEKNFSSAKIDEVMRILKERKDTPQTISLSTSGPNQEPLSIESIVDLVSDSEISSIQNVTSGIINIINDPNSTVKDLKSLIEIDPALTAKVLRTANSAKYFSRNRISDIEKAVMWIGFDNLKEIALNQKVCEIFQKEDTKYGFSRITLWKHCVAVAMLSKMIYRREFGEPGENIYAAGLLHDIGIISEDQFMPEDFEKIITSARDKKRNLHNSERDLMGFDHADIGKEIAKRWEFPRELYSSIGCHHKPLLAQEDNLKITFTLYIADNICHSLEYGYCVEFIPDRSTFKKCVDFLGLKLQALKLISQDMAEEIKKMEEQGLFL